MRCSAADSAGRGWQLQAIAGPVAVQLEHGKGHVRRGPLLAVGRAAAGHCHAGSRGRRRARLSARVDAAAAAVGAMLLQAIPVLYSVLVRHCAPVARVHGCNRKNGSVAALHLRSRSTCLAATPRALQKSRMRVCRALHHPLCSLNSSLT